MGWYHLGVIKALHTQGVLPKIVSGASAGSIVAAMLGVLSPDQVDEKLFEPEQASAHLNLPTLCEIWCICSGADRFLLLHPNMVGMCSAEE